MKLKAINIKPLEGNDIAPPLKQDEVYEVVAEHECTCGQNHFNVGLKSVYNFVRCYKCHKELPTGHQIHWCHPSRFELVIDA